MKLKLFLAFIMFCLSKQVFNQIDYKVPNEHILEFLAKPYYHNSAISISLRDVKSSDLLLAYNGDMALTPASLTKLVSMVYCHSNIGESYKYETSIGFTGEISDGGTLFGEIVVDPSGDPSLFETEDELNSAIDRIVNWLVSKRIRCVENGIKLNSSRTRGNEIGPYWPYQDIGNYYAPGIYSFNLLRNQYKIHFNLSDDQKHGPNIDYVDPNPNLTFINELVTGAAGSGDQAYVYGDPYGSTRFIRGSLPMGSGKFSIKGSLPDPFKFFAERLVSRLSAEGIECADHFERGHVADYNLIFSEYSENSQDLIHECLVKSDNLYAECLFKTAGAGFDRLSSIQLFCEKLGLNKNELLLFDGSGLSPQNKVSANALTKVLCYIDAEQSSFKSLIPTPADGGSLNRYAERVKGEYQISAKTGYMQGVRSIGGFLESDQGLRAFCIIINNHEASSSEIYSSCGSLLLNMAQKL